MPSLSRKSPKKHEVGSYGRGKFKVDPHLRGKGELASKKNDTAKQRGNYTKVVVGNSVQEEETKPQGPGIKTILRNHEDGTIQVVHMTPEEYLRLAAPNVFGGVDEYQISLVQENIGKGEGFKVPSLDVYPESMDVVASSGIYAAAWAHNNGVKRIPVMLVHTKNTGSMFGPRQYIPTSKKKDVNFRKLIRQGALGPSAWHYIEEKEEREASDKS